MMYDAIVVTTDGEYTFQNIEALNDQELKNKVQRFLDTEIIEIEIKKTFGEEFNYE